LNLETSLAVEVITLSVALWLVLACLEMPESAEEMLNKSGVHISRKFYRCGLPDQARGAAPNLSEEKRTEELKCVDKTLVIMAVRVLRVHVKLLHPQLLRWM
jgi:hypothetical protein